MKKKIFLMLAIVAAFVCLLAVSSSAIGMSSNEYAQSAEIIEGISDPTIIDKTSKVVIIGNDELYYTFPAYYILEDNKVFTWKQNTAVNEKLGINVSAQDIKKYIIRMEIPEGIESINPNNQGGSYAFEYAEKLIEVTFPSTLKLIGDHAFNKCYYLETINGFDRYFNQATYVGKQFLAETNWGKDIDLVIPSQITSLPERCFYGTEIKSITFHDDITYIGSRAFQDCNNITAVKLPSSLEYMKNHAFASCDKLASVDTSMCTGLKEIGEYAFEYTVITTFDFTPFAASFETISNGTFHYCTKLTKVTGYELLDNVTAVYEKTFRYCPLTEIKFPENILSIGNYAFQGHMSTQAVLRIPNGVTSIGDHAFDRGAEGGNGTKIYLSANLTTISENYTFEDWKFSEMYIPATLTKTPTGMCNRGLEKGAVFFYTGDKNGFQINTTNNKAMVNAEWISFADYTGPSSEKNYIVYGYNVCDAFYEGTHNLSNDDGLCSTEATCSRNGCGKIALEAKEHNLIISITYDDGFNATGVKICDCPNENCTKEDSVTESAPIFEANGYSVREDGKALLGGYTINTDALKAYNLYNNTKLTYGIVMSNASNVTFDNTNAYTGGKGVMVSENNENYTTIKYTISGFSNVASLVDIKLVITLYVIDGNGNMSFIQNETSLEEASATVGAEAVSVNAVTLRYIAEKTLTDDEMINDSENAEYKAILEAIKSVSVAVVPTTDEQ